MIDHKREHEDHEAGRFDNEHQAAFALSRSEYVNRDDSALLDKLMALGFYAVVIDGEVCCPSTDAILAVEVYVLAAFRNVEDAREYAEENDAGVMGITPHAEQEEVEDPNEDDIPF